LPCRTNTHIASMSPFAKKYDQPAILKYTIKWFVLSLPLALVIGSLVALFLFLLEKATQIRWQNEWLLYFLPVAGVAIVWLYKFRGKNAEAGNNLIMDEIHKPGGGIPARMAPFVLLTTVVTHLFGGSAGREGTAVQIGGSMASLMSRLLKRSAEDNRILLMMGIAAGFGAVFGTPVAGAIFALEVLAIGHIKYDALLPCLFASVLADVVCSAYGIHHTHYQVLYTETPSAVFPYLSFDWLLLAKIAVAGIAFGLVGFLFAETSHIIKSTANKYIGNKLLLPVIGGFAIIGLTFALGTNDYLGLGVTTASGQGTSIVNAFNAGGADTFSWFWKLLFTTITLSLGFKGGEVTPLFFIGATLGNTLAVLMGAPIDLMAALGFVAVFAGATNTPIACTLMGAELFGGEHILYYAVACFIAYYFSGHSGIYGSQRISVSKANFNYHSTAHNTLKKIWDSKRAK
jgi:H+/Cl- antiporter ClcA